MGFPGQERFAPEDVAARWGKSIDYVYDLMRRKKLESVLVVTPRRDVIDGKQSLSCGLRHYVLHEALLRFETQHGISPVSQADVWLSVKEAAGQLNVHEKTVRRLIRQKRLTISRTPGGHIRINERDILRLNRP